MSGRIRTIKPELLEDAIIAGLSDSAFRVFVGMIVLADDYGNLRAEHGWLRGQIYWSAKPAKTVEGSCAELGRPYGDSQAVLVTYYSVRGQFYAHINGWSKHQKVQHPGKPRVPGPELRDDGESHETLSKIPESLTPDLRPPTSDLDHDRKAPLEPRTRKAALPDNWEPDERDVGFARDRAWSPEKTSGEGAKFAAYHLARGSTMKDWHRAWQTWVLNERAFRAPPERRSGRFPSAPPVAIQSGHAYREDDDAETIARLRRMPKRQTAQDAPASLGDLVGKLKQGGNVA